METFVAADGRRIRYLDEGSGPSVCLVHGSNGDHTSYDPQVPVLVAAGYRAIAVDRIGRGESDVGETRFHGTIEAEDYLELLDAIGVERAVLAGHSSGAGIINAQYLLQPDRVIGLISLDSFVFAKLVDYARPEVIPNPPIDSGLDARFDDETLAAYHRNKAVLQKVDRLWDHPSDFNTQMIALRESELPEREKKKAAWAALPRDPSHTDMKLPPLEGKWCGVPLLAYTAGRGRIGPDDPEAKALREQMPAEDATLVVIKNSGHWVHWEATELFNRELLKFLGRLG